LKRQIISLLVIVPLLTLLFPGCSFGEKYLDTKSGTQFEESFDDVVDAPRGVMKLEEARIAYKSAPATAPMGSAVGGSGDVISVERKVLYTADIQIEVKKCDESIEKIKSIVSGMNGVIADTSVTEHDEGRKSATIVLRVPADKFETALKELGALGKVKSQNSHGDDITEEYVDLQARLTNAKRMEVRLIDLLENKSKKLKDMLDVERELGRVREKIERMEGKKRYFDQRAAMSTITVNLSEPYKYTSSILDPVKKALDKAGELFMKSLGAVLLFLAAAIPWFILFGFFVYIFVVLIRRLFRKRKKKDEVIKIEDDKGEEVI
jgi:hypothetical protein